MPYPQSLWSTHSLTPLPAVGDPAFRGTGILPTDSGFAVSWLGDCARTKGVITARHMAPSTEAKLIPLPCRGTALLFGDGTLVLVRADGRVFPAPFCTQPGSSPKPSALSRQLALLGRWAPEWHQGAPSGCLAPAFLPFCAVVGPGDEEMLLTLGQHLLAIASALDTRLEWCSQPVARTGRLAPPTVRVEHHAALEGRINLALAQLWRENYPIPAIPGQTLRDGEARAVRTDIIVRSPASHSHHATIALHRDRDYRHLHTRLSPLLSTPLGTDAAS